MRPCQLLVKLRGYEDCAYYGQLVSDEDMAKWVADPAQTQILYISRCKVLECYAFAVDGSDTLWQFAGCGNFEIDHRVNYIRIFYARDLGGNHFACIQSSYLYPDDVSSALTAIFGVPTTRADIYRVVPFGTHAAHFRIANRICAKLTQLCGIDHSYRLMLDPLTGKCLLWLGKSYSSWLSITHENRFKVQIDELRLYNWVKCALETKIDT